MALSNGNAFNGDLIFLNMRSQDKDGNKIAPHFQIAKASPGAPGERSKILPTGETATKVSGNLLRPRFTTREYKGVDNKHVILYLKDGDETYSIDCTYRISTRALFNAILSLTDPDGVEISVYESKKGYEALSLWQNRQLVPWKFDGRKGEIPEAITVMFKGKEQHDYTPIDDFFEAELKEWANAIFGPETESTKTNSEKTADSTTIEDTQGESAVDDTKTVTAASIAKSTKAASTKTAAKTSVDKPANVASKTTARSAAKPALAKTTAVVDDAGDDSTDGPVPF